MRCNNCGKNLSAGTTVCPVCGSAVQGQSSTRKVQTQDNMPKPKKTIDPALRSGHAPKPKSTPKTAPAPDPASVPEFVAETGSGGFLKLIALAVVVVIVIMIVNALRPMEKKIQGTWEEVGWYDDDGEYNEKDSPKEWEFKSNNKLLIGGDGKTYSIDDDILTIKNDEYNGFQNGYDTKNYRIIKLSHKKLVLEDTEYSGRQKVFEKQ